MKDNGSYRDKSFVYYCFAKKKKKKKKTSYNKETKREAENERQENERSQSRDKKAITVDSAPDSTFKPYKSQIFVSV